MEEIAAGAAVLLRNLCRQQAQPEKLLEQRLVQGGGLRTTLEIDDEVLERVKLRARHQHVTAGCLITDLLRRQLDQPPNIVMTHGVPVLRGSGSPIRITNDDVSAVMEELLRHEGAFESRTFGRKRLVRHDLWATRAPR